MSSSIPSSMNLNQSRSLKQSRGMKRSRPFLSACIIVLNEESRLPGLLESLSWVDEIVAVDGGSVDGTVRIAHQAGCRVIVRPFDNYAAQRNVALKAASGQWLFSIDADERPSPGMSREILGLLPTAREVAYRVPIRSKIFGRRLRFSGTQDDRPIRLFRKEAVRWVGDVHERAHVRGCIGKLRNPLLHDTLPDVASFLKKMNRYTTLAAQRLHHLRSPLRSSQLWLAPAREIFRRLLWKNGLLDGPAGWAFCFLSGLSEWMLVQKRLKLLKREQLSRASSADATSHRDSLSSRGAPLRESLDNSDNNVERYDVYAARLQGGMLHADSPLQELLRLQPEEANRADG